MTTAATGLTGADHSAPSRRRRWVKRLSIAPCVSLIIGVAGVASLAYLAFLHTPSYSPEEFLERGRAVGTTTGVAP